MSNDPQQQVIDTERAFERDFGAFYRCVWRIVFDKGNPVCDNP